MSVTKDPKRGTWTMYTRYVDWQGIVREKRKRGFATKREALEYEREFLLKKSKDINMSFEKFVEIYFEDLKPRIKPSTYENKQYIVRDKILPYFKNKSLSEIISTDIIQWQNALLLFRDEENKPYAPTYLRSIQNQLSAIMNHACKASIYDEHDYKHEGNFTLVYYIRKNEDNLDNLIKQIVQENNSIYKRYQLSEIEVIYETKGIYYICEKGEEIAKVVVENDGLLKKVSYQWSREKLEQNLRE